MHLENRVSILELNMHFRKQSKQHLHAAVILSWKPKERKKRTNNRVSIKYMHQLFSQETEKNNEKKNRVRKQIGAVYSLNQKQLRYDIMQKLTVYSLNQKQFRYEASCSFRKKIAQKQMKNDTFVINHNIYN